MSQSKFFKKLTAAEVGKTKTHEVYIRMPNDFDFENFFENSQVDNGSLIEVNFTATAKSLVHPEIPSQIFDLRLVYYYSNTNKEKRIPGISPLFRTYNVDEGEVVCLEKGTNNQGNPTYYIKFLPADIIQVYNGALLLNGSIDEADKQNTFPKSGQPLQQIFFGAPGTGKSHTINLMCAKYENYRTTFHPDTDYAAFVGSYKPITVRVPVYGIQGTKLRDEEGKTILEDRIVYRYIFQSFLKAYIAAWREQQNENPNPVFLIIEEINRGNCAQIFGDIFQLLDRNESGYSDYPIVADDDLKQELARVFANLNLHNADKINALYEGGKDVVAQVKDGSHLLLPNNMYIWATMNTSDQSLFPIDSAFKRRWEWKYIKIKDADKNYRIAFSNGNEYDWWQFVSAINAQIEGGEIQQEDKKLGYFFAKANNGRISAETFVSKVLFYLYNDVFKDFGLEEAFFKDENDETMTFASYFDHLGHVEEDRVELFVRNLGLNPIVEGGQENYIDETHGNLKEKEIASNRSSLEVIFPDGVKIKDNFNTETYIDTLRKIGLSEVFPILSQETRRNESMMMTEEKDITEKRPMRYRKVDDYYILLGPYSYKPILKKLSDTLILDLEVTE